MRLPERMGKYLLEELLDGGEADVYRALDTETGRMVVVTILSEAACEDAAARAKFLEEAGGLEQGESEDGQPFFVKGLAPAETQGMRIVARKAAPAPGSSGALKWIVTGVLAAAAATGVYYFWPREKPASATAETPAPKAVASASGDMVLVAAGNFLSGATKESIWLPAFYMDKTEVTNAAYAAFCKATDRSLPPNFRADEPEYPVVNVSMDDARAFAAWAGKRIPNGREWEKAARGEHGQAFPWGDSPDRSRANIGLGMLLAATAFANGASPYGARQMIGNAWEWTDETRSPTPEESDEYARRMHPPPASDEIWYAVRGGGFDSQQLSPDLIWDSKSAPERWRSDDIGFRCAK
ncbi:MAG TPA: SUMF1/EgtB/PvdO family nonheme iron enzyme [Bryobacteraceae bacterium]|nr:SUMF1/EgtB/PvdO family nonheme iron enzyme [Bryobacteraceae bacterium]